MTGTVYAARQERQPDGTVKTILMHEAIMEHILGRPLREDERVEHVNGDTLDNRRDNPKMTGSFTYDIQELF